MDLAKLQEMMKKKKAALKSKAKTIKPKPGANRYILLQGWRSGQEEVLYHEFGQHYIKDAAGQIQAIYPCEEATHGKPCAVCQGLNHAIRQTTDDDTVKLLQEARASQSFLFNVLALDSDDPNTPQILEVRKGVTQQIIELVEEWAEGVFDPANPQIITINRDGSGLNTKYNASISPKRHPLPKGVLERLHNLDEYVSQESEEQQQRALSAIRTNAGLLAAPTTTKPAGNGYVTPASTETAIFGDAPAAPANNAARNAEQMAKTTTVADDIGLDADIDALFASDEEFKNL